MDINDELPDLMPMSNAKNKEEEKLPGIKLKMMVKKPKVKRYKNSVSQHYYWVNYRDDYLDKVMSLESRGDYALKCTECCESAPDYRCKDCLHGATYCKVCILIVYERSPLHAIEVHFVLVTVHQLAGLSFHPGQKWFIF